MTLIANHIAGDGRDIVFLERRDKREQQSFEWHEQNYELNKRKSETRGRLIAARAALKQAQLNHEDDETITVLEAEVQDLTELSR